MKVSVLFSFRNEELVLEELITRIENVFRKNGFEYEMIFADDASNDRSLEILLAHRKLNPRIKILKMSERFGVANCFMAGFDHASGDAAIMMDADLQDPPELIPELIARWQKGVFVVHTVRTKRKGESFFKRALTALGYRIWKIMLPVNILMDSGDFRLLSKEAAKELIKFRGPDPFFRGLTRKLPFPQDFILYEREPRFAGETHFSLLKSLDPFKTFFSAIFSFNETAKGPHYKIETKYGFTD